MKIYVLPKLKIIDENTFENFIKFVSDLTIPIESSDTIQASSDGCWKCEKGINKRDKKKKIRVNRLTLEESTASDKDSIVVDDWIPADGHTGTKADIEYIITEESGINQDDIDQEIKKHRNFGNGMSTYGFNKKPCLICVCNNTISQAKLQQILDYLAQ